MGLRKDRKFEIEEKSRLKPSLPDESVLRFGIPPNGHRLKWLIERGTHEAFLLLAESLK